MQGIVTGVHNYEDDDKSVFLAASGQVASGLAVAAYAQNMKSDNLNGLILIDSNLKYIDSDHQSNSAKTKIMLGGQKQDLSTKHNLLFYSSSSQDIVPDKL